MKKETMLYKKLEDGKLRCDLCAPHCRIADGDAGFGRVRRNEWGTLVTIAFGENRIRK